MGCNDVSGAQSSMKKSANFYQQGQSTIEYLFLLLVVAVIIFSVVNDPRWQNLFGVQGSLYGGMKRYLESTYRHAYAVENNNYDYNRHQSYANTVGGGESRFFLPLKIND